MEIENGAIRKNKAIRTVLLAVLATPKQPRGNI